MSDKKYAYWNSVNTTTDSPWNLVVIAESAYLRGSVALCSKRFCALGWKNFVVFGTYREKIHLRTLNNLQEIDWLNDWLINWLWRKERYGWPFLNETLD